jgi:hypothetical protein
VSELLLNQFAKVVSHNDFIFFIFSKDDHDDLSHSFVIDFALFACI